MMPYGYFQTRITAPSGSMRLAAPPNPNEEKHNGKAKGP
jgi:hypothetical protein